MASSLDKNRNKCLVKSSYLRFTLIIIFHISTPKIGYSYIEDLLIKPIISFRAQKGKQHCCSCGFSFIPLTAQSFESILKKLISLLFLSSTLISHNPIYTCNNGSRSDPSCNKSW